MKKTIAFIILAVVITASILFVHLSTEKASRLPMEGAKWVHWQSDTLGIRLLYEDIADPTQHYILTVNHDWIEQHRPADDVIFGPHQIIHVLSKPADLTIEQAITQQFIAILSTQEARKGCTVALYPDPNPQEKNGTLRFYLVENAAFAKAIIQRTSPGDMPESGCGDYGAQVGTAYFEYRPQESKTKFLWVNAGFDPLFDPESIRFY